jgi:hypothetical protein
MSIFRYFALTIILIGCQSQPSVKGIEKLDQLPEGARAVFQPLVDAASELEGYEIVAIQPAVNPSLLSYSGDEIWCVSDKLEGMPFSSKGLLIRNGDEWVVRTESIEDWNRGCQ